MFLSEAKLVLQESSLRLQLIRVVRVSSGVIQVRFDEENDWRATKTHLLASEFSAFSLSATSTDPAWVRWP